MMNPVISLGAAEIAGQIRAGQITPLEVVEAYIEQIERINPAICALVTPTFEQARSEARRAGERLARKPAEIPPLLGVPVSIKDALAVTGVRFTAGSVHYRDHIAPEDAEAVRRLKEAGAIVLGKTNCADMSGSTETHNLIFGLTRNPWNLARSAGGSSGGEAALIAAGGSPLGLGADIAGSIRLPAAFCGIAGLKPTAGRIPVEGHFPPTPNSISGWNTVGPLARRVEDLALAMSVLSNTPVGDFRAIKLEQRRVLMPGFLSAMPVHPEVAHAVREAGNALSKGGMQVIRDVKVPLLRAGFEYSAIMHREWLPEYRVILGNGRATGLLPDLIANWKGQGKVSPSTLALVAAIDVFGRGLRLLGYGQMDRLERVRRQILEQMGPGGLMLWPVFPTTAPTHGLAWRREGMPVYTGIFNGLGFPAVVVPVGLSKDRLPLAVQIIAGPNEDEAALAVAALLEREFGGYQPPPSLVSTLRVESTQALRV